MTMRDESGGGAALRAFLPMLLCGCLIAAATMGVRSAFGLFTDPLILDKGWTREDYALAMALQNLCWGIGTPLAGTIVDRFGPVPAFAGGGLLYALGLGLLPFAGSPLEMLLTGGVMVGFGQGAASHFIVLSAFARRLPATHRPWALGIGTAAASFGQFAFVPLGQAVIDLHGWSTAALALAAMLATVPLLGLVFLRPGRVATAGTARADRLPALAAVRWAFSHPSYLWLFTGFFVCGFQLAFITTHLPAYLVDRGSSAAVASWGLALVGLVNIAGSYLAGVWGGRYSKKNMLCAIYLARGLAIAWFVLAPASTAGVLLFGAAMGALWLTTVPLTSGLVATFFGPRYMATLFGFVFLSHQVGAFLGVYLGGAVFARTGSYDLVWGICIALSLFAALVNFPIREQASRPFAALSAA